MIYNNSTKLMKGIIYMIKLLTMEEIFLVTYLGAVLISISLALLAYWIFNKDD